MENKRQQGGILVAFVLAVILLIVLVLCISFKAKNKKISLSPMLDTEMLIVENAENEGTEVTQQFDGVIYSQVSSNMPSEQDEEEEKEEAEKQEKEDPEEKKKKDDAENNKADFSDDNYLCKFSTSRKITSSDWKVLKKKYKDVSFPEGKSLAQMIINEMYARHGYIFNNSAFNDYFSQKSWYSNIEDRYDDMEDIHMSELEEDNLEFLTNKK